MIREKNFLLEGKHQKPIVTDVYFQPTQQPKPIVIFCHGYKGFKDWGAWDLVAEKFAEAGFFFIKFNFSHNGGTAEDPIDFPDLDAFAQDNFSKQLDDLQSVIDWITTTKQFHANADVQNLNLIGHSRGGGIVTIKAEEEPQIKKVITWNGVSDFGGRFPKSDDLQKWKDDKFYYVTNGRTKQKMPHHIQFYEDFLAHEERFTIERAVKNLKKSYLIIHAEEDPTVNIAEAKQLQQWNKRSELYKLPGSDHVFETKHPWQQESLSSDLEKVTEKTIQFIQQ
ncbi:alpha/beta fold hydrolase [Mesonia sp.]|uniref:alpha/beta hydrolase family protein n=1 Tax=Mesonia sp. TaxID=1960830 RepID=UPI00175CBA2A|nr:alpha/beta fold hydrolase [Mesonia sp.]HIB37505.1 alpha/beta fold hydrolase [Mesonia sp.]HIO27639.1 alpha/beta fold hydrolase [Flavobacteriaceae bacterium]